MGRTIFGTLVKYCKTEVAYAAMKDVQTKEQKDNMESFFFAETLKYSYLLFGPAKTLDLDNVVFNTEAHPIKNTWSKTK
jgi:mannosidase alpha-like ER degradation enhancer 2